MSSWLKKKSNSNPIEETLPLSPASIPVIESSHSSVLSDSCYYLDESKESQENGNDPDIEMPLDTSPSVKNTTLDTMIAARKNAKRNHSTDNETIEELEKPIIKKKKKTTTPDNIVDDGNSVPPVLGDNMTVLICGINPGINSFRENYAYAHGGNHFWPLLHQSHLLPYLGGYKGDVQLAPQEKVLEYRIGLCNMVGRFTISSADLSDSELSGGVGLFFHNIKTYKPLVIVLNGVCLLDSLLSHRAQLEAVNRIQNFASLSLFEKTNLHSTIMEEPLDESLTPYINNNPSSPTSKTPLVNLPVSKRKTLIKKLTQGLLPQWAVNYLFPLEIAKNIVVVVTPSSSARVLNMKVEDKLCYYQLVKELMVRSERLIGESPALENKWTF